MGELTFQDQMERLIPNNPAAVNFLVALGEAWHDFDDLVDRDRPMTLTRAFDTLFLNLSITRNPFYMAHKEALDALMCQVFLSWEWCTKKEAEARTVEERKGLEFPFVIRYDFRILIMHTIVLAVGINEAREAFQDVLYICRSETSDPDGFAEDFESYIHNPPNLGWAKSEE